MWTRRKIDSKMPIATFTFPLVVLTAMPLTIVFSLAILDVDRTERFRLFYPIIIFIIGNLIPLYIILDNKKMTQKMTGFFYEGPLTDLFMAFNKLQRFMKKSTVSPIVVNV